MGIYLSKPNTTKNSHDGESEKMRFGASSMQGWRMTMEDADIAMADFDDGVALFAVFDGHGGAEVAKFCGKYFPIELKKNESYLKKKYKQALEETFLKMDEILLSDKGMDLLKEFRADNEMMNSFAGCTANVVLFVDDEYYVANAGDSRAIICDGGGNFVPLSIDHKPDSEVEKKRIQNAGGYVSEGRVNDNLNLTRALGDLEYKKNPSLKPQEQIISPFPDVVTKKVKKDDIFMLIGCDGIWETLQTKEICTIIEQRISDNPDVKLTTIVEELLDRLIAKETIEGIGCDNMSAILIQFKK